PVTENAGDIGKEHVVLVLDPDDFRGPISVAAGIILRALAISDLRCASVDPGCATIGGFGHPDVRTMDPHHTGSVGSGGASRGVIHKPFLRFGIEAKHRVGRRIKWWVAEQWPRRQFPS